LSAKPPGRLTYRPAADTNAPGMLRTSRFLALLLGLGLGAVAPEADADEHRPRIVHRNDLPGHLLPGRDFLSPGEPEPVMGGAAAIAAFTVAERARGKAAGEGFLLLDAGDFYDGATEGDATQARAIVEVMRLMGYAAAAPGNHGLADGVAGLESLAERAPSPILACNVDEEVVVAEPGEDGGAIARFVSRCPAVASPS